MNAVGTFDRRQVVRTVVRSVAIAVGCIVVFFVAPIGVSESGSAIVRAVIALGLLSAVLVAQTLAVIRSETPRLRLIQALTVSVSFLVTLSAAIYLAISSNDPAAFSEPLGHVDALYLSMMTLTTVGFGDIGAVSSSARIAVMVQMAFNFATLGIAAKVMFGRARADALPNRI